MRRKRTGRRLAEPHGPFANTREFKAWMGHRDARAYWLLDDWFRRCATQVECRGCERMTNGGDGLCRKCERAF